MKRDEVKAESTKVFMREQAIPFHAVLLATRSTVSVPSCPSPIETRIRASHSYLLRLSIAAGLTLAVAGCASNAEYPNIGRITDMGAVLTPDEQKKAISDAQKQAGTDTSKSAK